MLEVTLGEDAVVDIKGQRIAVGIFSRGTWCQSFDRNGWVMPGFQVLTRDVYDGKHRESTLVILSFKSTRSSASVSRFRQCP